MFVGRYRKLVVSACCATLFAGFAVAEEQDESAQSRQSLANDQSATQWTFLLAHQWMDYHTDELSPGVPRSQGVASHWQGRVVMPLPEDKYDWLPISLLPRLTVPT